MGVFAFLNEKYSDAERELQFAFDNCHRKAYRNQQYVVQHVKLLSYVFLLMIISVLRRILSYLIPIKLLKGVLPSQRLLDNYPALSHLYQPLVRAYRIGDLKGYDDALFADRGALISRGTFLIMERVREGCLRTLFKRV